MTSDNYEIDTLCLKYNFNPKYVSSQSMGKFTEEDVQIRIDILKHNKEIVQNLLQLPKVEQKSDEWYSMRQNLITASDFAQALGQGKFGTQGDIITKKVRPVEEASASFSNPFFKWGNMFEPIANDIYSLINYGVKVHEFGLIPHKELAFFGASPDGITDYGIMVEIKCPYKRKIVIGGKVPEQYYYQIQGQLEVCGLTECDYFECQFQEYKTYNDFLENFNDNNIKGVIIECQNQNGNGSFYKYSNIVSNLQTNSELCSCDNIKKWIEDNTVDEFINIKFWYLLHYNLKRVEIDKAFVKEKLTNLSKVWDKIVFYRENIDKYELEVLKRITINNTTRLRPITDFVKIDTNLEKQDIQVEQKVVSGYSFIDDPLE
jgi:putative phage-type endonuclease